MRFLKFNFCLSLILVFSFLLSSCVTVKLPKPSNKKSQVVAYLSPKTPYVKIENPYSDRSWQNPHNGNTISYISNCNSNSDPSLKTIFYDTYSGINELKISNTKKRKFDSRTALETISSGYLDGVKTKFHTMIYKKGNCTYTLTYLGLPDSFSVDHKDFIKFLKSFGASP